MHLSQLTPSVYQKLYQDIEQFRSTFDLAVDSPESLDEKNDLLHTSLAIEELTELAEADSKIEQADAIVDTVYVLMGRAVHLGTKNLEDNLSISYLVDLLLNVANNLNIEFIPCWDEVHSSNMSKVCKTEDEYQATKAFYAEQGIELMSTEKGGFIIAKCAKNVELENKVIKQGKVLKSVNYRPADLAPLV
ncbi:nucleoside triphosphate pyrophosphohydrolase family protein [Aliivibrio fischeri]|uniref:nucleoside triphosphate pyrophosphohydrolase family protein n=1 Tax=Aliivibrio fischeri TaxID=668 RepID=UPI0012D9E867|nr:nucleoside triphosphate pyrophosphohydrolase family protein [Aliivibrio fischeri]MUK68281.1 SAM-dependent methyltransferase [Aliivibrio fischeri]MUK73855.1 SAM-dependent methyltransferase [Aliivibrio fischeri]MUK75752.1 SAM-dependent methyltransferase [Aliivibrio fischeri]